MPNVGYDPSTLRDGGGRHRESGDSAQAASRRLAGLSIGASLFGEVDTAGAFAGALRQAHQHQTVGLDSAVEERRDHGERADTAAGLGDQLTATTTAQANQTARAVTSGME